MDYCIGDYKTLQHSLINLNLKVWNIKDESQSIEEV